MAVGGPRGVAHGVRASGGILNGHFGMQSEGRRESRGAARGLAEVDW